MNGFSPKWLALREPIDHRSRSQALARSLAKHLSYRPEISVVDLGSGTGSNLRATAPFLPPLQHWMLIDYDATLLETAKRELARWADSFEMIGLGAVLTKSGRRITVSFRIADLANDLDHALGASPDVITASALFDLTSPAFIRRLATAASSRKAIFYTVLTYNGSQSWMPQMPIDDYMTLAFNTHQTADKGFGPSAGPGAPNILAEQFRACGYSVEEGDSPWELNASDGALINQIASGTAMAVSETGAVDMSSIASWVKSPRTNVRIGHTDTLAVPA
jgi:SAM-dependent methyltransferase